MKTYIFTCLAAILMIALQRCETRSEETLPLTMQIGDGWEFKQAGTQKWMPAEVPGVVHMDLLRNQLIDEPFFRSNETRLQWIDKEDWMYRTHFGVTDELLSRDRVQLVFYGLDTYADVYLNDSLLFRADNMFRTWEIECKTLLKAGENEMEICFHSPVKAGIQLFDRSDYLLPAINDHSESGEIGNKKTSVYTRKAAYHYGWDWGPRFVTSGIWRPVELKAWNGVKLKNIHYLNKNISGNRAELVANFELEAVEEASAELLVSDKSCDKILARRRIFLNRGTNKATLEFHIDDPELWWSNGLGEAHLYRLEARVLSDGNVVDAEETSYGIRTIKLLREKDSVGQGFCFELNGVPVYAKGANYIPNDNFLTRVTPEKYEHVVGSAADANFNMLRVWGGGIYENDLFYELCDRYGILVWQDFMFACNMYPGDQGFMENVKSEFTDNVKRLRNHPCIALWCGNNEMLQGWNHWGWHHPEAIYKWSKEDSTEIWENYLDIFHGIIPEVLAELDTSRAYWPSSPASDINVTQNFVSGDHHYWKNRDQALSMTVYEELIPRFMSEYGKGGAPEFYSVKAFTVPEDWNYELRDYAEPGRPLRSWKNIYQGSNYTTRNFKPAKDYPSSLYVSQLVQSRLVSMAIQAHRRHKPYNMGTMFWMLNECWPSDCGSALDYYGRWKAEMYAAKRAYNEVLISCPVGGEDIEVFLVSDRLNPFDAGVRLELLDFDGNILWEKSLDVAMPANSSQLIFKEELRELLVHVNTRRSFFRARVFEDGVMLSEHYKYFVPGRELDLDKIQITKAVAKTDKGYSIILQTDRFAKSVFLTLEDPVVSFSDNFFDLVPGEQKVIEIETGKQIPDLDQALEIYSLSDTYL